MEGTMLSATCFIFVVVAMAFPGLILHVWPEVAVEGETANTTLAEQS